MSIATPSNASPTLRLAVGRVERASMLPEHQWGILASSLHPAVASGRLGRRGLDDLQSVIDASRLQNSRFFGYVLGSGEPVAAGADLLASVLNQNVTAWRSGLPPQPLSRLSLDGSHRRSVVPDSWAPHRRRINSQPHGRWPWHARHACQPMKTALVFRNHLRLRAGAHVDPQGSRAAGNRTAEPAIDSVRPRISDSH